MIIRKENRGLWQKIVDPTSLASFCTTSAICEQICKPYSPGALSAGEEALKRTYLDLDLLFTQIPAGREAVHQLLDERRACRPSSLDRWQQGLVREEETIVDHENMKERLYFNFLVIPGSWNSGSVLKQLCHGGEPFVREEKKLILISIKRGLLNKYFSYGFKLRI